MIYQVKLFTIFQDAVGPRTCSRVKSMLAVNQLSYNLSYTSYHAPQYGQHKSAN